VLWNFGGQLWSLGLAFFTTPYIVHKLGTDAYGLLMTVGVLTSYLGFMDLGLGSASVKYISEHAAREEWDQVVRIFWTSFFSYLLLGTLAAFILILLTPFFVYWWLRIPVTLQGPAVSIFHLSALGFLIGMLNNAPASIPRALQRFDIVNRVSIAVGTTQTLLAMTLLALGLSVREVVMGNLVVGILSLGLNTWVARFLLPSVSRPRWDTSIFRQLLRFGGFVTVSGLVGPLLVHLEKVALASLVSASAVAYYAVSYNVATKLWIFAGTFSAVLFPLFSSFHGVGQRDVNVDVNLRVIRCIAIFVTVPALFFVVFGREFLQLWMGPEFARESTGALRVLAVAMVVNSIAWSPYALIQASGRPDIPAKFHTVELLIHLPLTWWIVRSWGVTGAAWAWFIRVSMGTAWVYFVSARLFQMKWRQWLQEVLNPALGVLVIGATIIGLLRISLYNHMSPEAVLWIFGGGFLTLAALSIARWGLRREELHLLVRALRGSAEG